MNFINFFSNKDLLVLFLFILVFIIHLTFIKKTKLFIDIIAVYLSFVLVIILPLLDHRIKDLIFGQVYLRTFLFVFFFILFHILFSYSNLKDFSARISPNKLSTSILYRVSIVGLFFTSVLMFLPDKIKNSLANITELLFTNFIALLIWFCLPLFFIFAYRFKTRRGWIE